MPEEYLVIVTDDVDDAPDDASRKGCGDEVRDRLSRLKEVRLPISQVEHNMQQFLQLVGRLFRQVDEQIGAESAMQLEEVELSVEISGEGEVKLVAGGKATAKGAIKLKFTRK
jgi:hypothetical protein